MRAVLIIAAAAFVVGLTIYSILDIARTERSRVKAMPKTPWVLAVILFPLIGPLLWLTLGFQRETRRSSFPAPAAEPARQKAPDEDTDYLGFLARQAKRRQAAEQKRLDEQKRAEGAQKKGHDHLSQGLASEAKPSPSDALGPHSLDPGSSESDSPRRDPDDAS